jgi:ABC-type multidrug transport system permease subunit
MKLPADSLILASANLVVTRLGYFSEMLHIENSVLGAILSYLPVVASPVLLLATIIYLPRDLWRRDTRLQGLLALLLSIPCILFLRSLELA